MTSWVRNWFALFTREELKRYSILAVCFFCMIGSYWMLRVMKNSVFMDMVGHTFLPRAKLVSIASLIFLLMIYNKLIDWIGGRRLIKWVYGSYLVAFLLITFFLAQPEMGLGNQAGTQVLGWILYVLIESFGSLGVVLLWSYTVSITDHEHSKRVFPLLAAAGNLGSLAGTSFVYFNTEKFGLIKLLIVAALWFGLVPILIRFIAHHPLHEPKKNQTKQDEDEPHTSGGIIEGLRIIFAQPYLIAILAIVVSYETTGAFFDYLMNASAKETLGELSQVTKFFGLYGMTQSILSVAFALFGTTTLLRFIGLTPCLLLFPLILAALNTLIQVQPGLWTFFIAQVGLKGFAYALNKPCLEILYVSTSANAQFKAKSWIDTVGSRSGKAFGSMVNDTFSYAILLRAGGAVIYGVLALWLPIAWWVGYKNRQRTLPVVES